LPWQSTVCRCASHDTLTDDGTGGGDTATIASEHTELPCAHFDDLWDNLVFDDDIKHEMVDYVNAIMMMSDRRVDPAIVTINRLLLFHGALIGYLVSINVQDHRAPARPRCARRWRSG
jgi:hypothetical protein